MSPIEVVSQGEGPVIVILPSLGRGAEDYDEVAAPVWSRRAFRILRPQPRGIGRSKGALDNITLHDLAADIAFVIENEGRALSSSRGTRSAISSRACSRPIGRSSCVASRLSRAPPDGSLPEESPYDPKVQESVYKSGDLSLSRRRAPWPFAPCFLRAEATIQACGSPVGIRTPASGQSAALRAVPEKNGSMSGARRCSIFRPMTTPSRSANSRTSSRSSSATASPSSSSGMPATL